MYIHIDSRQCLLCLYSSSKIPRDLTTSKSACTALLWYASRLPFVTSICRAFLLLDSLRYQEPCFSSVIKITLAIGLPPPLSSHMVQNYHIPLFGATLRLVWRSSWSTRNVPIPFRSLVWDALCLWKERLNHLHKNVLETDNMTAYRGYKRGLGQAGGRGPSFSASLISNRIEGAWRDSGLWLSSFSLCSPAALVAAHSKQQAVASVDDSFTWDKDQVS